MCSISINVKPHVADESKAYCWLYISLHFFDLSQGNIREIPRKQIFHSKTHLWWYGITDPLGPYNVSNPTFYFCIDCRSSQYIPHFTLRKCFHDLHLYLSIYSKAYIIRNHSKYLSKIVITN